MSKHNVQHSPGYGNAGAGGFGLEGNSLRATARMTDVARMTVEKLLRDLAEACQTFHDEKVRNLATTKRIQCDEIWSFCYAKTRTITNSPAILEKHPDAGDVWTWTAIDADSKLMVSWFVGDRGADSAHTFMHDVASRIPNRIQITTDGLPVYLNAVEDAFGDVDYAILNKIYGGVGAGKTSGGRYSPAKFKGATRSTAKGFPDAGHISTSFVERQNLTMRIAHAPVYPSHERVFPEGRNACGVRRAAFCLLQLCKVHTSLRVTPAMESEISDHAWELEELVGLWDS